MTVENNYWTTIFAKRLSRRKALVAMGAGLGLAGLTAAGCKSGREPSSTGSTVGVAPSPTSSGRQLARLPYASGQPKHGGTFRYYSTDPIHFDFNQTSSGFTTEATTRVMGALTTMRLGPQYAPGDPTIEPWTAEKWERPDPTTYVFSLRKGAKFANVAPVNGRELTSEDVKYSIAYVSSKQTGNPELRYRVDDIASVEAPDKYTVKFKLGQTLASFMTWTAGVPYIIIPHETIEKYGDLKKPDAIVGAGPWILDKYEPKVGISYRKNPDFFLPGKPFLDRLELPVIGDAATRLAAFRGGKLDATYVTWDELDSLKATNPDILVDESWSTGLARISFSLDKPPFNDVRVRRAVALAVDLDGYAKNTRTGQKVGPITPAFAQWFVPYEADVSGKWYNYDPAQAKQLLAEAGYPNGFETTVNGTTGQGPVAVADCEMIAASLSKIGVKAKVDLKEYAAYQSTTILGKFEGLARTSGHFYSDPEYYLWSFFYPGSPNNHGNVDDAELNKLLKVMKTELDEAKRTKAIQDIQKRVRDQVYGFNLPLAPQIWVMHPYVKNFLSMRPRAFCAGNWGKEAVEVWLDK